MTASPPQNAAPRCALEALRVHEPAAGTAARATCWVMLEQSGAWGKKAVTQSDLDPHLGAAIDAIVSKAGGRFGLIREPGKRAAAATADRLVLVAGGYQLSGTGPQFWVVLLAGLAIGAGTYSGGWRIMRTMGKGIVEIETPQGAASGAATTATILASAHLGFGLSTTHVATGSILGSGIGRRGAEVRWRVARRMAVAWMLTLPGAALVGGAAALLSEHGIIGVIALLVLLTTACVVIWVLSRRNRIDHRNVTDSAEVLVLATASPDDYPAGARPMSVTKARRKKQKSAA